jgi:hypothetical protein
MKRLILSAITAFILVFSVSSQSQEDPGVILGIYPYAADTIASELDTLLERGYLPVGVEVSPGQEITVLFILHPELKADRWLISEFDNLGTFEEEFTKILRQGWMPMDISFAGETRIEGWRMVSAPLDPETMQQRLAEYQDDGFTVWGISGLNNQLWFLLLKLEEAQFSETCVNFFSALDKELTAKIESDISSGWTPWGLLRRSASISILYGR